MPLVPWIIMGVGSFALSAMSFTKDIFQEAEQGGDEVSNVMLVATLAMVAGAGVYLITTNKIEIG